MRDLDHYIGDLMTAITDREIEIGEVKLFAIYSDNDIYILYSCVQKHSGCTRSRFDQNLLHLVGFWWRSGATGLVSETEKFRLGRLTH